VAAWATAAGVGFIALMLMWLVGNRVAGLVWGPPVGPTVAILGAVVVGAASTLIAARRLRPRP